MTERVLDIALRADGLLATFAEAGVLGLADVNTAGRLARLAGEEDDPVRLALALAVRALRNGSVCLELATAHELPALDETGEPVDLPLRVPADQVPQCLGERARRDRVEPAASLDQCG